MASSKPYREARLVHHNYDLSKRWYVIFWAWDESKQRMTRKRLNSNPQRAFSALQKQYGLTKPDQIKQRIILDQVLAIAEAVFGNDKHNKRLVQMYRTHFKICEAMENKSLPD